MASNLPQGTYGERVRNDLNYKIDPKTGRAVKRTLFGLSPSAASKVATNAFTLAPKTLGLGALAYGAFNALSNVGSNSAADRAKQAAATGNQQPVAPMASAVPQQAPQQVPQTNNYNPNAVPQGTTNYQAPTGGFQQTGQPQQQGVNNLQAMFGPSVKTTEDLMTMRNKLADIRYRAASGMEVPEEEFAGAMGLDFGTMNPNQIRGLMKARGDLFNTPIARIDAFMEQQNKAQESAGLGGVLGNLPNAIRDDIWKIRNEYESNPTIKDYKTIAPSYNFLKSLDPQKATNSEAQAALIAFTKALDPTSVVREGELQLSTLYASNPSLANQLSLTYNKLANGRMVPGDALKQVIGAFDSRYESMKNEAAHVRNMHAEDLNLFNLDSNTANAILNDYTASGYGSPQQQEQLPPGSMMIGDNIMVPDGQGGYRLKSNGVASAPGNVLNDIKTRLARVESSGSYAAVGPRVKTGMYKDQVALGKYQIMEGNVTPWAKELLGINLTPEQFYYNPDIQEKLADAKLSQLWNKYGNKNDVASAWFTGGPLKKNANAKDVTGTSATEYVRRFNA